MTKERFHKLSEREYNLYRAELLNNGVAIGLSLACIVLNAPAITYLMPLFLNGLSLFSWHYRRRLWQAIEPFLHLREE